MFDQALQQLPSYAAKRAAITAVLSRHHEEGTLTYTDLLLNPRELWTIAFEILDGVTKTGDNIPQYDPTARQFEIGQVRLVSIDPTKHIKISKWHQPMIPGMNIQQRDKVKVTKDHGLEVTLDDRLEDGRPARIQLVNHGWPIRQFTSRTGEAGHIVEWKWFERAATGPDANDEYRELHATLKKRMETRTENVQPTAPAKGRPQETRP
jgi:hypothetical protein